MKVRELPGWPPPWGGAAGPRPPGAVGVLRSVDWRVDLRGSRDLWITIEYEGHLWSALYPGSQERRIQFEVLGAGHSLDSVHQTLSRYVGETLTRIGELELPRTG